MDGMNMGTSSRFTLNKPNQFQLTYVPPRSTEWSSSEHFSGLDTVEENSGVFEQKVLVRDASASLSFGIQDQRATIEDYEGTDD